MSGQTDYDQIEKFCTHSNKNLKEVHNEWSKDRSIRYGGVGGLL
jgi:hypothetical protein